MHTSQDEALAYTCQVPMQEWKERAPDDDHFPDGQLLPGPQVVHEADREHEGSPPQHEQHQQHKEEPQCLSKVCVLQANVPVSTGKGRILGLSTTKACKLGCSDGPFSRSNADTLQTH